MRRKAALLLSLILFALLQVQCTSAISPEEPANNQNTAGNLQNQSGTMVFPIYQDPGQLNPYLVTTGETGLISKAIYEGLAELGPDGNYFPRLATEIPTLENGGVSTDGLTVTWRLKENVVWSDGEPFTSDDVRFTWEMVTNPGSLAQRKSQGWELIDSLETPDVHTVVVRYKDYYYNFLDQFLSYEAGILPRHACGDPSQLLEWECNLKPVGTGPFILEEWRPGESVTLARNPRYREPNKPYLDRIVFPIVPDENVRKNMLMAGEGDAILWLNFEQAEELQEAGVQVTPGTDMWLLRLGFNLSNSGDSNVPHPILGDVRVRRAIQLAIDPELINQGILNGQGKVVSHELYRGLTVCPTPEITYSKEAAADFLVQAGWIDEDGDGVRECHNCLSGDEGAPLSLNLFTSSDPPSYSRMIQLIADELSDVGIRAMPSTPENHWEQVDAGDFDLNLWDDGYSNDPLAILARSYSSANSPGSNFFRFINPDFDALLAQVKTIQDPAERLKTFCQIDALLFEQLPIVWLAVMPYPDAFSARMKGWEFNPYDYMTWDIANWSIQQ